MSLFAAWVMFSYEPEFIYERIVNTMKKVNVYIQHHHRKICVQ